MNQWPSQSDVYSENAELSADFLLRLAPMRPGEGDPRPIEWSHGQEAEEVELEIEVAPCGEIVSLHFHGRCFKT